MKAGAENEVGVSIHSPGRKTYNPFDSDDEDTDALVKSNVTAYDIKNPLAFHLDTGDLSWEEAMFPHFPVEAHAIPADANGEALLRKDSQLFNHKNFAQDDLPPEYMVLYKASTDQSVKDIGIDEGFLAHGKIWTKINENRLEKDASLKDVWLDSEGLDKHHSVVPCLADGSINVDEYKHDLCETETNSTWQSAGDMKTGIVPFGTGDNRLNKINEQKCMEEEEKGNSVSKDHDNSNVPLVLFQQSFPKLSTLNDTEAIAESSKSVREEASPPKSLEIFTAQESGYNSFAKFLSYNRKVESGNLPGKIEANGAVKKLPETQTVAVDKPPETLTMSRHDGEMSSSAEMLFPASMNFMTPNARCGSVSLRSESSVGSTRSFAFPVMQTEWISSPTRMAKADTNQTHVHKHQGWFHTLICCKF